MKYTFQIINYLSAYISSPLVFPVMPNPNVPLPKIYWWHFLKKSFTFVCLVKLVFFTGQYTNLSSKQNINSL